MDKTQHTETASDLQLVELGDAKEMTMGIPNQVNSEDNPQVSRKFEG